MSVTCYVTVVRYGATLRCSVTSVDGPLQFIWLFNVRGWSVWWADSCAILWNLKVITVFKIPSHLPFSGPDEIRPRPEWHLSSTTIIMPASFCVGLTSGSLVFRTETSCVCYMPCQYHPSGLLIVLNQRGVHMKLLIMQFSLGCCSSLWDQKYVWWTAAWKYVLEKVLRSRCSRALRNFLQLSLQNAGTRLSYSKSNVLLFPVWIRLIH